jgi:hypothetical protein
MYAGVLRERAVFELDDGFRPLPLRAQFGGFGFKLFDREAPHQSGIVDEAVIVGAEQIARDPAAGGLIGLGAEELAEIGIQRDSGLDQQMPDSVRRNVGVVLQLAPHRELRRVIRRRG